MTIGENLKKIRKEKGITQEQLAKKLDVSIMTIRRFESGAVEPKTKTIKKIASALGVDELRIFLGVSEESAKEIEEMNRNFRESLKYENWTDPPPEYEKDNFSFMLNAFFKLNETGKEIAAQRVQELTEIERYTNPEPEEAKNAGEN